MPASTADDTAVAPWHQAVPGGAALRPGDPLAARQWAAAHIGDDAAMGGLRTMALLLADSTDWSRHDDHAVADQIAAACASGHLVVLPRWGRPTMYRLIPALAPAPPPAPPAPAPTPRAAPATPPPPVETTFSPDLDVAAMVAVLQQAAQDGVPFCEECDKARRAAEAMA